MTSATIEQIDKNAPARFQARAGNRFALGRTMGEALDALIAEENGTADSSLVVLQRFQPDAFFTEGQIQRLQELMARRDNLTEQEKTEREELIRAELIASAERSAALADALGR